MGLSPMESESGAGPRFAFATVLMMMTGVATACYQRHQPRQRQHKVSFGRPAIWILERTRSRNEEFWKRWADAGRMITSEFGSRLFSFWNSTNCGRWVHPNLHRSAQILPSVGASFELLPVA
jgi:hypothetical protein